MGLDSIKYYVIGVIFLVVVVGGGMFMMGSIRSIDPTIDPSNDVGYINNTMNQASGLTNAVNGIGDSVNSVSNSNTGILGWLNALIGSAYNGLSAIGSSFGFIGTMVPILSQYLGIPVFLTSLILLVIIIIIAFGIWAVVTRAF